MLNILYCHRSFCLTLLLVLISLSAPAQSTKPNFIIILTDDQGYGDVGSFGAKHVSTPTIDRLVTGGIKLTNFYMGAPLCTPARAALLTGCYPKRIDMATGSSFPVLLAVDPKGLNPEETTIAELLKTQGYTTGLFGKWHLGDQREFLPTRQGFDEFFGIPYSHDIHPYHPFQKKFMFPPLPLLEGDSVIETDPNADLLTSRITGRAIRFIEEHAGKPFFLYLALPMPHHPIHVAHEFQHDISDSVKNLLVLEDGTVNYTARGYLYPQAIAEIDNSVDRIMKSLHKHSLDSTTLVIFMSDNGPDGGYNMVPLGSAGPLRGRKGSTYEGGSRVAAAAWWPGYVPSNSQSDEILTAMDVLPTLAALSGASRDNNRVIDGHNIWDVLSGVPGASSPHQEYYYYAGNELKAVRSGRWKYHKLLPPKESMDSSNAGRIALFDLSNDVGETNDVSSAHPNIVKRLDRLLRQFELEKRAGNKVCADCRPSGWVTSPRRLGVTN